MLKIFAESLEFFKLFKVLIRFLLAPINFMRDKLSNFFKFGMIYKLPRDIAVSCTKRFNMTSKIGTMPFWNVFKFGRKPIITCSRSHSHLALFNWPLWNYHVFVFFIAPLLWDAWISLYIWLRLWSEQLIRFGSFFLIVGHILLLYITNRDKSILFIKSLLLNFFFHIKISFF